MITEEMQDRLVQGLLDRMEQLNIELLEEIGKQIKYIGTLTPSQAHKLAQIILYGENVNWIARRLSEVTNLNVREIYQIMKKTAIENQEFARQFYKAKGIDFIPYEKNVLLQNQVRAIATLTANRYKNIMNSTAYVLDDKLVPIGKIYQEVVDKAILSVSQGKESYQTVMRKTMNELVEKGMRVRVDKNGEPTGTRVVDYKSGLSRRADTAIRMNTLEGIRTTSNELQKQFGEEFGADGIEISVHEHPAPDHADIQGKQFTNEEFEELNESLDRPIGTLNCYHYIFSIVLGVSKPEYTKEQLEEIKKDNDKGFEFEGKHYTLYEGTQLQRRIETKIRELKDKQIMSKAMGDIEQVGNCQRKITELTHKYRELSNISGLKTKMQRMTVSGYRRIKVS